MSVARTTWCQVANELLRLGMLAQNRRSEFPHKQAVAGSVRRPPTPRRRARPRDPTRRARRSPELKPQPAHHSRRLPRRVDISHSQTSPALRPALQRDVAHHLLPPETASEPQPSSCASAASWPTRLAFAPPCYSSSPTTSTSSTGTPHTTQHLVNRTHRKPRPGSRPITRAASCCASRQQAVYSLARNVLPRQRHLVDALVRRAHRRAHRLRRHAPPLRSCSRRRRISPPLCAAAVYSAAKRASLR